MNWMPILNETDSGRVAAKLEEIADTLMNGKDFFESHKLGLLNGRTGMALFFFYYSLYSRKEAHYDFALETISDILDNIDNDRLLPSFTSGLAGIGWLLEHLNQHNILDAETDEMLADVDRFLKALMIREIQYGQYDFLHNAIGHAFYFLSRSANPQAREILIRFVDELEKISVTDPKGGIKWRDLFSKDSKEKEIYNLGMAHGMPAIIVFLARMIRKGIAAEKSLHLLKGAVTYLLRQELDREVHACCFPTRIFDGREMHRSRMGWCYGDLGIGMALWQAAEAAKDTQWKEKALDILIYSSKRKELKENSVNDAGLCHGAAGIAQVFNRMFLNTRQEVFKDTAIYWTLETLKMAQFDDGLAGYKCFFNRDNLVWATSAALLDGISGIGLGLLAAISPAPNWDACFLLS